VKKRCGTISPSAYVTKSGSMPQAFSRLRPSISVLPSLSRTIGKRSPLLLISAASSSSDAADLQTIHSPRRNLSFCTNVGWPACRPPRLPRGYVFPSRS
jgi:hypothetical protein